MNVIRPSTEGHFPRLHDGVHEVALGNMTQFTILIHRPDSGYLWVGIQGKGCYPFGHPPHPSYVEEKMRVMDGDAANLADFITDQILSYPTERQGEYMPSLCN